MCPATGHYQRHLQAPHESRPPKTMCAQKCPSHGPQESKAREYCNRPREVTQLMLCISKHQTQEASACVAYAQDFHQPKQQPSHRSINRLSIHHNAGAGTKRKRLMMNTQQKKGCFLTDIHPHSCCMPDLMSHCVCRTRVMRPQPCGNILHCQRTTHVRHNECYY